MGPHSFKCGSYLAKPQLSCKKSCFNGAALFQVRKCARSTESTDRIPRFNGAALFQVRKSFLNEKSRNRKLGLQWGRTLSSAEVAISPPVASPPANASMGPHSFKCGSSYRRRQTPPRQMASMGPHSFKCGSMTETDFASHV